MSTILIVEDDQKLNEGIRLALKSEDYYFVQCRILQDARNALKKHKIDLVLLDVNLPDGSGMAFLTEIRKESNIPVIIITANNMETDIVTGLELGANDYITKPFSLMVLRARVSVQLRQNSASASTHVIIDAFDFNFAKMIYRVNGYSVELSKTEQKLLKMLIENKGATLSRSQLIDRVWSVIGSMLRNTL